MLVADPEGGSVTWHGIDLCEPSVVVVHSRRESPFLVL